MRKVNLRRLESAVDLADLGLIMGAVSVFAVDCIICILFVLYVQYLA